MSTLNQFLIPIVVILSIVFFVRLVFKALFLIWLFQLKEYRFDRLFVHFRETKEGKRFFWSKREFALWLLFTTPFFYRFPYVLEIYIVLVILIFGFEAKVFIEEIRKKQLRKPIFSKKAILLIVLTLFTVLAFSIPFSPVTLMFVDRFLILIVAIFVFVLGKVAGVVKTVLIFLSKRKLSKNSKLLVIGITGSYGKSSTKDLIAEFLSEKYNVLKTPGSVNTDLGIALFVLRNLKPTHQIFVVEIGAYKRGEIAAVCRMVRPSIGVITGINEQHLSLFGSLENTKKAKFELIESLPEGGMAFFNGDDPETSDMSKLSKVKKAYVYTQKQLPSDINMSNMSNSVKPFLSNLAVAYLLTLKLGVEPLKLQQGLDKTVTSVGLKTIVKGGTTVVDDTFNTNPAGFRAALEVLATFKAKKILVTPGIIELGSQSQRIHKELGEGIGTICDVVILTNDNFVESIREGLVKTKFDLANLLIPTREELASVVKSAIKGKTVLLVEGRVPKEIIPAVIPSKA